MTGATARYRLTAAYVVLALTWGASFLFIKVGLEGLSSTQVVLARLVLGAATLGALCLATRCPLPLEPRLWAHLAVVAALLCVLPFLLFAWAEQYVSSALASIVNATTPLMTVLVATVALPQERMTRVRAAGLLTGLMGVAVLLGSDALTAVSGSASPTAGSAGRAALLGPLACLLATASYGVAFVHLRRTVSPLGHGALPVATIQVGLAAAAMLVVAPVVAAQPVHVSGRVAVSMLLLGAGGTGLAYVLNTAIVVGWGASAASTVTYATPLVGVALGAGVLGEQITWNQPAGAVLVVAGILVTQGRLRRRRPRAAVATAAR